MIKSETAKDVDSIIFVTIVFLIITIVVIIPLLKWVRSQSRAKHSNINEKFSAVNESEYVTAEKPTRCRANIRPLVHVKRLMNVDGSEYQKVEKRFREQWTKRTNKYPEPPTPVAVYAIQNSDLASKYDRYKEKTFGNSYSYQKPNEEWHFHGTSIECDIISSGKCCSAKTCGVCGISRNGFDLSSVGKSFQRFGKGIYLAPNSSKSNDYATSNQYHGYKAQLLCRVACGKKHILYNDDTSLVAPPANCHSVYGKAGGVLNYDEIVVYDANAINPQFIIIYGNQVKSSATRKVAQSYQPRNKPLVSHRTMDDDYSWYLHSLNDNQSLSRNVSTFEPLSDQSRSSFSFGGITDSATSPLGLEHKTDSYHDKHKGDSQNDWYRSSLPASGVSNHGTPSKGSDVKHMSESHYDRYQSRSSPSKQNYGSSTLQSKCEVEKQKNKLKDGHDQSWSSYIAKGISGITTSMWSEPTVSKQTKQSSSSPSVTHLLERKVGNGKQKRDGQYESLPARRASGCATPDPSSKYSVGGIKQGSESEYMHDQSRSLPSARDSATSELEHEMEKRKNEDLHGQSWSSYIGFPGITASWLESTAGKRMKQSSSSHSVAQLLEHEVGNSKQKRESQYDQSPATRASGSVTPWSKHSVSGIKQKSKNQYIHDQSESSSSAGSATSQSECEMEKQKNEDGHGQSWNSYISERISSITTSWFGSGSTAGKQKNGNDQPWSSLFTEGSRFASPLSEHKASGDKKESKRSSDQSNNSEGFSRYATSLSEQKGGDKQKYKRQSDKFLYSPSSSTTTWSGSEPTVDEQWGKTKRDQRKSGGKFSNASSRAQREVATSHCDSSYPQKQETRQDSYRSQSLVSRQANHKPLSEKVEEEENTLDTWSSYAWKFIQGAQSIIQPKSLPSTIDLHMHHESSTVQEVPHSTSSTSTMNSNSYRAANVGVQKKHSYSSSNDDHDQISCSWIRAEKKSRSTRDLTANAYADIQEKHSNSSSRYSYSDDHDERSWTRAEEKSRSTRDLTTDAYADIHSSSRYSRSGDHDQGSWMRAVETSHGTSALSWPEPKYNSQNDQSLNSLPCSEKSGHKNSQKSTSWTGFDQPLKSLFSGVSSLLIGTSDQPLGLTTGQVIVVDHDNKTIRVKTD